ncbi:MAG: thioredoxin family protein [Pseudomonadota bacterium]|uniref:Thioredoxin family protein n=1 Tax=Candidatus Desulfatibia profunda TaxID=2841695 RepID=A0A8J6TNL9_9BACT|nr:thioredoxin family protein [Candidatus Desulfatibia profunda]MBL7180796.1 thioredoxin family protein [Desulfobacterales bacterium]
MRFKTADKIYYPVFIWFLLLALIVSCENNSNRQAQALVAKPAIPIIKNKAHFKQIVENSDERLLMIEFYADWCPPCKELAPVLEEIAKENKGHVNIYKINTDENRDLAYTFRVTGIPHVVFIKNKESVFSLSGLYPKKMYLNVISRFSTVLTDKKPAAPDGAT